MAGSQPLGAAEVVGMGMGEHDRPHITRRLPDPLQRGEHSRQVAREPGVDHARSCRMGPGLTGQAAERRCLPCRACPGTGTRRAPGQLAGELRRSNLRPLSGVATMLASADDGHQVHGCRPRDLITWKAGTLSRRIHCDAPGRHPPQGAGWELHEGGLGGRAAVHDPGGVPARDRPAAARPVTSIWRQVP